MKKKEQSKLFISHVEDSLSTQDTEFQFSLFTHFTFTTQFFCKNILLIKSLSFAQKIKIS